MLYLLVFLLGDFYGPIVVREHKLLHNLLLLFPTQILAVIATPLLFAHVVLLLVGALALAALFLHNLLHSLFHDMGLSLQILVVAVLGLVARCLVHGF